MYRGGELGRRHRVVHGRRCSSPSWKGRQRRRLQHHERRAPRKNVVYAPDAITLDQEITEPRDARRRTDLEVAVRELELERHHSLGAGAHETIADRVSRVHSPGCSRREFGGEATELVPLVYILARRLPAAKGGCTGLDAYERGGPT